MTRGRGPGLRSDLAGLLLLTALLHAPGSGAAPARQVSVLRAMPGREALAVRVVDAGSGEPLPSRIVVRDAGGKVVESRYERLAGVFTDERGMLEMPLRPGTYSVEVHRGIDFLSRELAFDVQPGVGAEATVPLEPWLRLREKGWAPASTGCGT